MSIPLADKIIALLTSLNPADVQALPPAERRRFADSCRRAADLADPPQPKPAAIPLPGPQSQGILSDLRDGARAD